MREWFRVENAANDPSTVDIHIIDFIGGWVDDWMNRFFDEEMSTTARSFVEKLAALDDGVKTIRVHINSPGGDVFAALNIANALRDQQAKGRTVETIIDGLAASAASIIAMAGSTVRMADNALLMIHNPWTRAVGEAKDLRQVADELDKIRGAIVATYQWHSDLDAAAIEALMDAETWLDAEEAVAQGFATERVEGLKAAATIDPRAGRALNVPERFRDRVAAYLRTEEPTPEPAPAPAAAPDPAPDPAPAVEVLRLCREAGCLDLAEELVTAALPLEQVQAKVSQARAEREAASRREQEIRSACALAKCPELADGYVRGGMSVADVKAHLTVITAKIDHTEIDGSLDPGTGGDPAAGWKQAFARVKRRGFSR